MPAPNKQNRVGNTQSPIVETLFSMKKAWIAVGVLSCFVNVLMLTGPLYMLQVYDRVINSGSMSTLMAISVLMVIMYGFMGIMELFRSRILVRIGNYIEARLGQDTFRDWIKQGLQGKSAAQVNPLNDLGTIKQFMTGAAPTTFFDIPWVPIYIAVIFMLDWTMGVFASFGGLIVLIVAIVAERSTRKQQSEYQHYKSLGQTFAQQCHRNAEAITSMGMTGELVEKWSEITDKGAHSGLSASDRSGSANAFSKSFRMFMQSAVLGLGAALAVQQIITPGTMIAGSIILGRALAPIQMVIGQWRGYISAKNALKRLNAFYEDYSGEEDTMPLPTPTGMLTVQAMTAGPPGAAKASLTGIQFTLQPGDGMCVVGPSASGKSTLARLLVGVWMPQRGSVRLDGATFSQWDKAALGPHIGYLPQEIELFDGTVAQNISRFKTVDSSMIVLAAQKADVHDLILNLPNGYDTRLGQGGYVLSVGQVQRVALARALFGDPCLVVMDEPNSNLDAKGDEALNKAILGLRQCGKTVIVITHRQSAMAAVNKILVLRDGKQIKFGLKEEVFAKQNNPVQQSTQQPVQPPFQQVPQQHMAQLTPQNQQSLGAVV